MDNISLFSNNRLKLANFFYMDENYSCNHGHMVHSHANVMELLYIYRGNGEYFVNDRKYTVHSGDFIICDANILHGESPFQQHDIETYCCAFSGLQARHLPKNSLLNNGDTPVFSLSAKKIKYFNELMPMLYNLFPQSTAAWHLALAIFTMACEEIYKKRESNLSSEEKSSEDYVRNIMAYIDKNYKENISLEKISKELYISSSRLSHIFKEKIGMSPIQYAIYRRIGEAQSLLLETNLPIWTIEESLGFSSSVHFSMMFKKYVGISPKQYRQHFIKTKMTAQMRCFCANI